MRTYFGLKPSYILITAVVGLLGGIGLSRHLRNEEETIFNHQGYRLEVDVNEDGILDFISKTDKDVSVELGNGDGTYKRVDNKSLEEKAKEIFKRHESR